MVLSTLASLAKRQASRVLLVVGLLALSSVLVLTALGFAIGGSYSAIEMELGSIAASFIVAGGLLVLAGIAYLIASRQMRRSPVSVDTIPEVAGARAGSRWAILPTITAAFAFGFTQGLLRRR